MKIAKKYMTDTTEAEPKPHHSSAAVNMVLALEYQQRTGRLPSWAVVSEQVNEVSDDVD